MSVSVPTACSSVQVAAIVASGSFLNQTSTINNQAIFTASTSGLYRINAYAEGMDGANHNPSVSASLTVNDDVGTAAPINFSEGLPYSTSSIARIPSGGQLFLSLDIDAGSPTFSFYYVIEQLQ